MVLLLTAPGGVGRRVGNLRYTADDDCRLMPCMQRDSGLGVSSRRQEKL